MYKLNDQYMLCVGYVYDDGVVIVENCFLSIFDIDCYWIIGGVIYMLNDLIIFDFVYVYINGCEVNIDKFCDIGSIIFIIEGS